MSNDAKRRAKEWRSNAAKRNGSLAMTPLMPMPKAKCRIFLTEDQHQPVLYLHTLTFLDFPSFLSRLFFFLSFIFAINESHVLPPFSILVLNHKATRRKVATLYWSLKQQSVERKAVEKQSNHENVVHMLGGITSISTSRMVTRLCWRAITHHKNDDSSMQCLFVERDRESNTTAQENSPRPHSAGSS